MPANMARDRGSKIPLITLGFEMLLLERVQLFQIVWDTDTEIHVFLIGR